LKRAVIYFGFNNPKHYKRGVENVVEVQASSLPDATKYYVFFDSEDSLFRWGSIVCIGVRRGATRFIRLNLLLWYLLRRLKDSAVILHSHNYLASLFLLRHTDLFSVHDGLWYQKRSVGSRIPWLFHFIEIRVYRRCKMLHCNSHFTLNNSLIGQVGRVAAVIPCSTPLEGLAEHGATHTWRFAPPTTTHVLSVRSIEPRARIDLLLEMAELAMAQNKAVHFTVAGKGPLLEIYRNEIRRRGLRNIELLGYVSDSDLARLYAGCDCVLMTCEHGEGFGLPLIEGYLFGKPVIASNRCAVPEIVISPEYLVENDAAAVLNRLISLRKCNTDPSEFVTYYNDRFSNRVIRGKFRQLYDLVVSDPSSTRSCNTPQALESVTSTADSFRAAKCVASQI
jgi:glycosyltransferase involved in cell wall biosynthesis